MPWPPDLRPREPPGLGWPETLACGLLLGCTILLLETVQQPIAEVRPADIQNFLTRSGPTWWTSGVAWAFFARSAEPRLGSRGLVLATVLAAVAFAALAVAIDHAPAIGAVAPPRDAFAAHALWTNGFYGGLYVAAYAGWRRSVRSRRAMARLRQVRDESAALLQQSRLDSFRGALQPQTVVHAVDALRWLYRQDAARGDALLDMLVGFLRPAVRGLGAESSPLREELDLAVRYLELRANTVGGVGAVRVADTPRAPDVALPPRLLTPTLEALCLAGARVGLDAAWREGAFQVSVTCDGAGMAALPPPLRRRMAATAQAAGVTGWLAGDLRSLVWTLRFDSQPTDQIVLPPTGEPA